MKNENDQSSYVESFMTGYNQEKMRMGQKSCSRNTCFSGLYNEKQFRTVTRGPLLKDAQKIFLKGKSVLKSEISYARSLKSNDRICFNDHFYNSDGEGEPSQVEEIIE